MAGRLVVLLVLSLTACSAPKPAPSPRPELRKGPSAGADVATFVASELRAATKQRVLVYVGASWCEPCKRFHEALSAGELDGALHDVRFLEFDADADRAALKKAGYTSRMIPLFNRPKPDGSASDQQIEGSIRGPSAVAENLVPRLRILLGEAE